MAAQQQLEWQQAAEPACGVWWAPVQLYSRVDDDWFFGNKHSGWCGVLLHRELSLLTLHQQRCDTLTQRSQRQRKQLPTTGRGA